MDIFFRTNAGFREEDEGESRRVVRQGEPRNRVGTLYSEAQGRRRSKTHPSLLCARSLAKSQRPTGAEQKVIKV